ncbi:hypothetical protein [Nocardioides lijunqiniae]|uniref:hypothetical protein n=1 Tax=Nocardioides lijunqiniae TaxID=2760832 RepID=UPI001878CDEA|nr:hypothetical protein [Nocardioides lijunqiniae]
MTWTTFHRRGEILRSVIRTADERRDATLPLDLDGVTETFGDALSLLAALQLRWHTHLAGRIDRVLADEPLDLSAAVEDAWADAADALPGVRMILDGYRSAPLDEEMGRAMVKATAKEHMMLAVMAGRSSVDDPAAASVGARIEEAARLRHRGRPAAAPAHVAEERPGLLERLKSVVAA